MKESTHAATSRVIPVGLTTPEQAKELLTKRLTSFLTLCGSTEGDYQFTDFSSKIINLDARFMWKIEVKVSDEQAENSARSNLAFVSQSELDKETSRTREQFANDNAVLKGVVDRENTGGFHALYKIFSKVNVLARRELYGYAVCPRCHGSRSEKCRSCNGTGQVKCPDCKGRGTNCPRCQGRGYLNCPECSGRGVNSCTKCHGKGLTGVRRTIVQQITRSCSIGYLDGEGNNAHECSDLSEIDKSVLSRETGFEMVSEQSGDGYCLEVFSGRNSFHQIKVKLKDNNTEFLCTACGDGCELISRPFLFDNLCVPFLKRVSEIVSYKNHPLSYQQVEVCQAIASNQIIASTVRGMDTIITTAYEDGCKRFGLNFMKLAEAESEGIDQSFRIMQAKVRPDLTRRVAMLLRQNASFFASEEFCSEVAGRLVSLVPFLIRKDPDRGLIWNAASIVSWFTTGFIMFFRPVAAMAVVVFLLSLLIPPLVSLIGTRSMIFYCAASRLKITHLGKKIPDMKPDALSTVKYLFVNTAIIVIMLAFGN